MQNLTSDGHQFVKNICSRYNLSFDAVIHMLISVQNGGGSMAQFNCPELGGGGQWMRGGMTMVGDMFNYGLKNTVDNLCNELSNGLNSMQIFPIIPPGAPGSSVWWPQNLGNPFSSGSQNNSRYAIFNQRLAVDRGGKITVYNTLDHQIGGISQQQGNDNSMTFSSQYGTIPVSSLPIVSGPGEPMAQQVNFAQEPVQAPSNSMAPQQTVAPQQAVIPPTFEAQTPQQNLTGGPSPNHQKANDASSNEILALIEKLGQLKQAGILTEDEFQSKKIDLLNRL
jgi:hypothetical protein